MKKQFAQINGYRLSFAAIGAETAPAVVLSHALATRGEVWGYQLPLLSRHFRVILYDVRGHGESEASGDNYSLEELANDVLKLLDYLSIRIGRPFAGRNDRPGIGPDCTGAFIGSSPLLHRKRSE
jgi:pimeloyl-ACP methyl ester carboxylesterase